MYTAHAAIELAYRPADRAEEPDCNRRCDQQRNWKSPRGQALSVERFRRRIGDTLAVNAVMEVGAVSDSVQVTAAAALLETETSATGTSHQDS